MPLGRVLLSAEQIARRVGELGLQIRRDFEGQSLTIVAILQGSIVFLGELLKHLGADVTVELIEASSYGTGTASGGQVTLRRYGRLDVRDRDVLLVDDIADTGRTLAAVARQLEAMGARSVRTCVLLDKPSRRVVDVELGYRGFEIDDVFVVGYGLDHAGRYRTLPYIACLDEPARKE